MLMRKWIIVSLSILPLLLLLQVSTSHATAPTAEAGANQIVAVNSTVNFDGSGSHDNDEGGQSIVTYSWNFGSGADPQTGSGATPSCTYTTAGEKTVTLTVTDDEEVQSSPSTCTIKVVSVDLGTLPDVYMGVNDDQVTVTPSVTPYDLAVREELTFKSSNESKATLQYYPNANKLVITGKAKSDDEEDVTISVELNSHELDTDTITVYWPWYIVAGGTWQPGQVFKHHPPPEAVQWETEYVVKNQFRDNFTASGLVVQEKIYMWDEDEQEWKWLYDWTDAFQTENDGTIFDLQYFERGYCFAEHHMIPADQYMRIKYTGWYNMWHNDRETIGCEQAKLVMY